MRGFFLQPILDIASGFANVLAGAEGKGTEASGRAGRGARASPPRFAALGLVLVALVGTWWIYVPVHELLHVLGCVLSGGTVSELQIAPRYGGALLARLFPFVVAGGDYAGRLTGFDTHGSDLIYLATDAMPFVLSVLLGIPLLKAVVKKRSPILFGVSIVLALAPIYNLTGDYYEMGSIMTTRCMAVLGVEPSSAVLTAVRGDDVFRVVGDLWSGPEELGSDASVSPVSAFGLVIVSQVLAILLGLATYWLGDRFAKLLDRRHHTRNTGLSRNG